MVYLETLTTNKIIRKLRIEQKKTQTQFYKGLFSRSVYQKIENGEKKLNLHELILIANNLGIDLFELLTLCAEETKTDIKELRERIQQTILSPNGQRKRESISEIQSILKENKKFNPEWFNLYLFFSIAFRNSEEPIIMPSINDLHYLEKIYSEKTFFTLIDYKIYLNCINIYGLQQIKFLEKKLFPVKQKEIRSQEFISTVFLAYNNMICQAVYVKNYTQGFKYLKQALKFENREIEYSSKIQFLFLEQLLYCQLYKAHDNHKKEIEAYLKAYNYAELVESLGDTQQSKIMYHDLEQVKENKDIISPGDPSLKFDKPTQQDSEVKLYLNSLPPRKIK
ncbi:hypothetical protein IV75_GL000362 [Carnobacterium maltaromaticum]|nr:hypothetical protein IV75_GL000362 [Carnobacterium maltaromaticum]